MVADPPDPSFAGSLWLRLLFGEPTSAPPQAEADEAKDLAQALNDEADAIRAEAKALLLRISFGCLPDGVLDQARLRLAQVRRPPQGRKGRSA